MIYCTFAILKRHIQMITVQFYDCDYEPHEKLTYSVIAGRYEDKWIFVRHRARTTWEIAGGHIEEGESPEDAANREFTEETGSVDFEIRCVATYSVTQDGATGYGRLFYAVVKSIGPLSEISEIGEVCMDKTLPDKLTHPEIQPRLFERVLRFVEEVN